MIDPEILKLDSENLFTMKCFKSLDSFVPEKTKEKDNVQASLSDLASNYMPARGTSPMKLQSLFDLLRKNKSISGYF